jgi:hypothetical protein
MTDMLGELDFAPDVTTEAQPSLTNCLLDIIKAILPKWEISLETLDRWYRSL